MSRQTPENFKRPERHTAPLTQVGKTAKVKDVLKEMPAHYLEGVRNNPETKDCCSDPENLEYSTHKTDPALNAANLAIFKCTKCGAKHYRGAAGAGNATS